MMEFIKDINEARMTRDSSNARVLTYTDCCERLYLTVLTLELLRKYPTFTNNVQCHYIRKPRIAKWGYNIIGENALWDPGKSEHFQLHPSEENNLIVKILALAGIAIKDVNLYQIASQEDAKNTQQEKQ